MLNIPHAVTIQSKRSLSETRTKSRGIKKPSDMQSEASNLELNRIRSNNVQAIMRFDMSMSFGRYLLNII